MTIAMNIIAFLLIIALAGLIAVVVLIVNTVRAYIQLGKRVIQALERPINAATNIYDTGIKAANAATSRVSRMEKRANSASGQVGEAANKIGIAFSGASAAIDEISKTLDDAIEYAGAASHSIDFAKKLGDVLRTIKS
ncbi:MAG: hypothetical protein P4L33_06900 [Capsulimonadaceae bacterium]|nr:hypothetical protein [Capsulimonadaceae bacterium]